MEIKSSADFVLMTRGILAASGYVRHEAEGVVWWEGGRDPDRGAVVLVHGANDQAGSWFTVAPAIARQRRVIIPDLAGHGESSPRSGPIPISLVIRQLHSIIGEERDVTLVGNSLGGWISLLYVVNHPDRVSQLVLEASGGLARPIATSLVAQTREEAQNILRAVHGPSFIPQEWIISALLERAADSPMLRLTEAMEHNVEPRLGEIDIPTTLIWGAQDGVLPLAYAREMQSAIRGSRLEVIEGAAHIPHMQQPERFLACLNSIF